MHRSGTSCLAGTLQQAGLYLGEVSKSNIFNKKGNRENTEVMKLNNSLLQHNNADWIHPPDKVEWDNSHLDKVNTIITDFEKNCTSEYWGFKDPRILLTFPFWESIFPEATLIGTIRNPVDVAHSLNRRKNGPSLKEGLELWLSHNTSLLHIIRKKPFPLISFDYQSTIYQKKTKELLYELFPRIPLDHINFFDNSLRTPTITTKKLPSEIHDCYTELQTFLT